NVANCHKCGDCPRWVVTLADATRVPGWLGSAMRNVVDGVKAEHWVDTWVSTPQRAGTDQLPPEPFTRDGYAFADTTVRQTLRVSLGGAHLRLRFSNLFGDRPLRLTRVWVALPADGRAGARAVTPDSARPVTFSGHPAVAVPAGGEVESDPLDFPLSPATNITVTLHIAEGLPASAVTSHPGSRTTSYLAVGDRVADDDVADEIGRASCRERPKSG